MKKHLYIYGILILIFVVYNLFFRVEDERTDAAINILATAIIFQYIAWMAFVLLKKMRNKQGK